MADGSTSAKHGRARGGRRPRDDSAQEWRLWRLFGFGLAFVIFALVVISTSL